MYFSGQGKLYIGTRQANGDAGAFRFVGNVPELTVSPATETLEHKEQTSGQRLTDKRMRTGKSVAVNFPLEEFTIENLALALFGTKVTVNAAAVTDEVFPSGLVVGNIVRLKFPDVSAVVIRDSNATPATLVLDTDYRINSAKHGSIEILNLGAFVQPFKADYSYALHTLVALFTTQPPERWLRFEGLNTENGNQPVLVELYRVDLDPLSELALINEELARMPLAGSALYDATKEGDTELGQFGRMVLITA